MLERAWDAHWALRLICVVLFFDMAMMLHARRGVWQWSVEDKALLSDVGWIALTLVAFSFVVAIVTPALLLLLRQISFIVLERLPAFLTVSDDRTNQRPLGYVPARALRDLALNEKDDFLLRMHEAHERDKKAGRQSRERAGELTGAAQLAALADWLLAHWIPGSVGLIGAIVEALVSWASIATAGGRLAMRRRHSEMDLVLDRCSRPDLLPTSGPGAPGQGTKGSRATLKGVPCLLSMLAWSGVANQHPSEIDRR